MRSIKAMFKKQSLDMMKNRMVLIQFIMMPLMAFVLTELVAKGNDDLPNSMFVTMFAAMFVGMGPLVTTAGAIAEDRERKSLRFIVMAGVKQHEYLIGIGGFVLLICVIISFFFGLIGGFSGLNLLKFTLILVLGSATSIVLGAAIGMISKNQQSATAISVPVFMIFSFCPMIAQFNETVEKVASVLYTQQINTIVNDITMSAGNPYLIILANLIIFTLLFAFAYRSKGLKG